MTAAAVRIDTSQASRGLAVEIAKLVLEFIKALAWPLVTLLIVWWFRSHLERILGHFGDRLKTAETLKLGVMGQEVQISGTAKELVKERELLVQSPSMQASDEKLLKLDRATRQLNTPMADFTGMTLLSSPEPLKLEELASRIIKTMNPREVPSSHPPFMLVMIGKQVEEMINALKSLSYATEGEKGYELTEEGRAFFKRVQDRYGEFLARFHAVT